MKSGEPFVIVPPVAVTDPPGLAPPKPDDASADLNAVRDRQQQGKAVILTKKTEVAIAKAEAPPPPPTPTEASSAELGHVASSAGTASGSTTAPGVPQRPGHYPDLGLQRINKPEGTDPAKGEGVRAVIQQRHPAGTLPKGRVIADQITALPDDHGTPSFTEIWMKLPKGSPDSRRAKHLNWVDGLSTLEDLKKAVIAILEKSWYLSYSSDQIVLAYYNPDNGDEYQALEGFDARKVCDRQDDEESITMIITAPDSADVRATGGKVSHK